MSSETTLSPIRRRDKSIANRGASSMNLLAKLARHRREALFGECTFFLLNPAFRPVAPNVTSVLPPPPLTDRESAIQLMELPHATHPSRCPDALLRFGGGGSCDDNVGAASFVKLFPSLFLRHSCVCAYPTPALYGFSMRPKTAL